MSETGGDEPEARKPEARSPATPGEDGRSDSLRPGTVGLEAGALFAERYRVVGPLGQGGMGSVYRVEHVHMGRPMALKVLRPELGAVPALAERFEREARSAARLDDPHVVRVTDFGRDPSGALYMVMDLVEGSTLAAHLAASGGRLPLAEAVEITAQILHGLEHAHRRGVVHRDVKPGNVMLTITDGEPRVKLLDFGIAKLLAPGDADTPLTHTGMAIGTPRYMAPEQAVGEPVDARADLYALGVMLYELTSGRPPFTGASAAEVLGKHLTERPPPVELVGADARARDALQAVIDRALAKTPAERHPDAAAFRRDLEGLQAVLQGKAEAAAVSLPAPAAGPHGSWRRTAAALAAALGSVALVGVLARTSPAPHGGARGGERAGPAVDSVVERARTAPDSKDRRAAYEELERRGEATRLGPFAWLSAELEANGKQPCQVRKWYVERLLALGDPRGAPLLERELAKKDDTWGLMSVSDCMARAIREGLPGLKAGRAPIRSP